MSGSERGLVEEYVEKVPNPSLKSEWRSWPGREGPSRGRCWREAWETAWHSEPGCQGQVQDGAWTLPLRPRRR